MQTEKLKWFEWNPGCDHHDNLSLGEVLDTMPSNTSDEISEIVHIFENPESQWALPGAISLDRHDCVHILLGRGMKAEDEGFVIGYCMGNAVDCKDHHKEIFMMIAKHIYPQPYNLNDDELLAFQIGFNLGRNNPVKNIHMVPLETYTDQTIKELRDLVNIKVSDLHTAYLYELSMLPTSKAAKRLDTGGADTTALYQVDGIQSDWKKEKLDDVRS